MTIVAEDVIENQIKPALETIAGLSVLDGFLIHYAKDLLAGKDGLSFPCIAIQPSVETITSKSDLLSGSVTRSLRLIGAVSTKERSTVRRQLDELARDVRKALAVDKFNKERREDRPVVYSECSYDLPDGKDEYAFFDMKVDITINEVWT